LAVRNPQERRCPLPIRSPPPSPRPCPALAGKRIIQKHRLVLSAIKDLMDGDSAPVHAIDKLVCEVPA
jgi:hypothetical protein